MLPVLFGRFAASLTISNARWFTSDMRKLTACLKHPRAPFSAHCAPSLQPSFTSPYRHHTRLYSGDRPSADTGEDDGVCSKSADHHNQDCNGCGGLSSTLCRSRGRQGETSDELIGMPGEYPLRAASLRIAVTDSRRRPEQH